MADLTNAQLRAMHRRVLRKIGDSPRNFKTPDLKAAFQTFEDERVARETALFADVDTSTSPKEFGLARKRLLYEAYMFVRGKG